MHAAKAYNNRRAEGAACPGFYREEARAVRSRFCLWLLVLLPGYSGQIAFGWTTVGTGIEYQEYHLSDPNNVFVARMERDNPACTLESSIGQGRLSGGTERVSSQAARYDGAVNYWVQDWGRRNDVVVAVNGDFYDTSTGVPASGQIHSGWFAKRFATSAFSWTLNREPIIGNGVYLKQRVTYIATGNSQQAQGINRARGSSELIIYTPQYDNDTNTDDSGVEVLVEMTRPTLVLPSSDAARGRVRAIRQNQGSTPIPFDHIVLSATGTAATTLLNNVGIGADVGIALEFGDPGSWTRTYASVGGGEVFLMDNVVLGGQVALHPRTAVAFNDDHVFFVVVDGRSAVSIGMNMTDLGTFCKDVLGATWGINLDGGGSSTMVVNGVVMNDPSDGHERSVANGMMMIVLQPKVQSTTFGADDRVRTTSSSNVRLGPGANYPVLTSFPSNTQGVVLDHSLRGIYAKGYYWWKCDFGGTVGWVAESLLGLVSAGNLPTITQHPSDQENLCSGDIATFSVSATGAGALGYQWQKHGVNLSDGGHHSGVTTSTLTVSNVDANDTGSYRCVVTDDNGSTTSYSAALLPPGSPTTITRHPQSLEVPPAPYGADVSFTVAATGEGSIGYQWQKEGNDLSDDGHYSGVTTFTLTIHDVSSNDDGHYRCRVIAGCGTEYSSQATLKVITADFDGDNDVDLADFGHLQSCFSGPAVSQTDPDCLDARLDRDSDVDRDDLSLFQRCFSGPNYPHDPTCLD